ncbi:MAG TPA: ligase-associated DNA damage response exonuclease [Solibacterales bacterium]|nr:ligase-associated DNA damage response exonuclease [Bryobacterales bacterium]
MPPLLRVNANGLYCETGDFYVDPWCSVATAVITHAHSDHARWGSDRYLTSEPGVAVLRARMGESARIEAISYGEAVVHNGVRVSLHPAGHILGSSQIRLEYRGEVWVVSGDYKLDPDPTCTPFEAVRCHTFITESTFGLPIYRWPAENVVAAAINDWWRSNQQLGLASVIFAYSLGKAQRVLAALDAAIGPIYCHGAVERLNGLYRAAGVRLPATHYAHDAGKDVDWSRACILAPPSAAGSIWLRRFSPVSTSFASGWMRIRGTRRRRALDRGFVLSDHADWPGLLAAISATGAECVMVTHGYRAPLVRWLEEHGKQARAIETRFEGEQDEGTAEGSNDDAGEPA